MDQVGPAAQHIGIARSRISAAGDPDRAVGRGRLEPPRFDLAAEISPGLEIDTDLGKPGIGLRRGEVLIEIAAIASDSEIGPEITGSAPTGSAPPEPGFELTVAQQILGTTG